MAKKPIQTGNIRRLLIRSTNWIGDAVMTTPAVRAIGQNFSEARIYMLAKPWVAPIFENNPHVHQILIYDSTARHKGLTGKFRLARDLKAHQFDAAILLQNAFEAALITFLAGIPVRVGFKTDARGVLLSHPVACLPEIKRVHQTAYYLQILKAAGLKTDGQALDLFVDEKDRKRAVEILRANGVKETDKVVGMNPSATYGPAKQWSPERYARLSERIQQSPDARVVLFGGPDDRFLGRTISAMTAHPPVDLCGKTRLKEAIALIEQCDLFITNDSGLMHVAAALGVPMIAIFGSTNPVTTGPWSQKSRIVRIPVQCSPCLKPTCPEGHLKCLEDIDPDMVFEAAKGWL